MLSTSLKLDDFIPVELEDKQLFNEHYKKYPPVHSDNLFTTMISWKEYSNYHYLFVENNLIIMTKIKNKIQFRPPSGNYNKDFFKNFLKLAKKEGSDYSVSLIDAKTKEWMKQNFPSLIFFPHREYYDYVYLSKNLAELAGSDYSKIRNRLNKFIKNHQFTIEPISNENMNEINEFLKRWCLWKDCESDPILENEKKAILYSMAHFFDLKLSGIIIRVNEKIEAISVYETLSQDTAVVHYEKGTPDYDGIYKAINQETAKILQKDFKYINRQSDMNLPGLRKAKMSYRPHHMIEVSHIEKRSVIF